MDKLDRAPSLLSVECSMLKLMKDNVWEKVMQLKNAFPEDYHAHMILIMRLEKEVNAKSCW